MDNNLEETIKEYIENVYTREEAVYLTEKKRVDMLIDLEENVDEDI